ncbi:MAG: hypothetical protein CMI52_05235 [Parcubacteria group bacterium]|nr:hypothetical protein [Parcubacteria group bacterium]|tara:strand:- start:209 stop:703 length:495 start_codon:yes stop_codon:yes gene_type:complete
MRLFRIIRYIFFGVSLGLLEWLLFNIAPFFGMLRVVLMVSLVLLVRGHISAAFVIGFSGMLVRDIGSFTFSFPLHAALFVILITALSLFARRLVTHHSMIGFGFFGLLGFVCFRVVTDVAQWIVVGSAHSFTFFFWTEIFLSFMIYIVIVGILQRKWGVLRVDW